MAVDLYTDDFSRLSDSQVFEAIAAFTRISEPIEQRPKEGFLLDYKEQWGPRALHTVAGFAHTFGGLLIVGVKEGDLTPIELVGVEVSGELKTAIASSVATNISPTPAYEIAECHHATKSNHKLAVVRVKQGHRLHYFTKKKEAPIYVRNDAESVPADAAQLRSLIERVQSFVAEDSYSRVGNLQNNIFLSNTTILNGTTLVHSPLEIILAPTSPLELTLDSSMEQKFASLVATFFEHRYKNVSKQLGHDSTYFEWRWICERNGDECAWKLTSRGELIYAAQSRATSKNATGPVWSLGNTILELLCMLMLARCLWKQCSHYYGEAHLFLGLTTQGLLQFEPCLLAEIRPYRTPTENCLIGDFNLLLKQSITDESAKPTTVTGVVEMFNSAASREGVSELVARVANSLVRGQKHSADLDTLQRAVDKLATLLEF